MTNGEALEYWLKQKPQGRRGKDFWLTITKALDKQIPKKPKCYEDKFIHCPSCGIGFGYKWECYPTKVNDYSYINYCYGCGQQIDWSEGRQQS